MSELPLPDNTNAPVKPLGWAALIILAVVFAPAAVACLFNVLHP